MFKMLFIGAAVLISAFIIVAIYCAMVVAGRSDENENDGDNNEGYADMLLKKQICPRCKTGKDSYELDQHSEFCPYIGCWKKGKCSFYVPLDPPNRNIQKKEKNLQKKKKIM